MIIFILLNNELFHTVLPYFTCAPLILSAEVELTPSTGGSTTLHGNHCLTQGALDQELESLALTFFCCMYLSNSLSFNLTFLICETGITTPVSQSDCEEQQMEEF